MRLKEIPKVTLVLDMSPSIDTKAHVLTAELFCSQAARQLQIKGQQEMRQARQERATFAFWVKGI